MPPALPIVAFGVYDFSVDLRNTKKPNLTKNAVFRAINIRNISMTQDEQVLLKRLPHYLYIPPGQKLHHYIRRPLRTAANLDPATSSPCDKGKEYCSKQITPSACCGAASSLSALPWASPKKAHGIDAVSLLLNPFYDIHKKRIGNVSHQYNGCITATPKIFFLIH